MEGNPYEGADDGGKNQQQGSVFLPDVLLAPGVLWVGGSGSANVVDVVGVLQRDLHQVDDKENADERGGLDEMVKPISAPRSMRGESELHLSKGR